MEKAIELAEQLGKAISQSPQALALRTAREHFASHPDLVQLLRDYQMQADKIAQLERENKPIEVEDKHKLEELHNKLIAAEPFKKLTSAQVEYIDLMRRVNEAMQKHLTETASEQSKNGK